MSDQNEQPDTNQKLPWTEDRVEQLKKMWAEGLSASQIAAKLAGGVTRNAVIGKVHRLGLSNRNGGGGSSAEAPAKAEPKAAPETKAAKPAPAPEPPMPPPPGRPLPPDRSR